MKEYEKKKIMIWSTQFNLGGLYSGVCLLKFILQDIYLDTNATTSMIRTKLSSMDIYIHTVGNDITKFNAYFIQIIDTLASRCETAEDLLINLFNGYGDCTYKLFVEYIQG